LPVRRTVSPSDVVLLEVQREAGDAVRQLERLQGQHRGKAVHAGDTVTHLQHGPDLVGLGDALVLLDLGAENLCDLVGAELHRAVNTFLG